MAALATAGLEPRTDGALAGMEDVSEGAALRAELLTGQTGVRITGVAVDDMTDAQIEAVRRLVSTYCVAVFPDQFVTPQQHVAFVRRFHPITFTPGEDRHLDWPDVHVIARPGNDLPPINGFHTDTCFVERPPSYTSLAAVELPPTGGDTVFANLYIAYEGLSPVMQRWLSGLRFKHVVTGTKRPEEVPNPVWHPALRTNPVTGRKALYVTLPMRCIEAEGMTQREGKNLIAFLYEHAQNIYAMYRHRWQPGDLVMWDNRCTLHAGVYDHGDAPRTLYRVMCEGERPFE